MSILGNLLNSLVGKDDADFTPPVSICPGNCPIGPNACEECQPYKEKLKEELYNIEHLDAFYARYEVVSSVSTGTTQCPYCGGPSSNRYVCDYCGMQLAEDNGKIRVTSASQIPDPVIEARDIIYKRQSEIVSKYKGDTSGSWLAELFGLTDGSSQTSLGQRMSKEEIEEAAKLYNVSVASYLAGLDNGIYKSLSQKKSEDAANAAASTAGTLFGSGTVIHSTGNVHPRPPQPPRPPMQPFGPRPQSGKPAGWGQFSGGQKPNQGFQWQGQGGQKPGQSFRKPGQTTQKPGQNPRKPGKAVTKPGKAVAKPAQTTAKPGKTASKPGKDAPVYGTGIGRPRKK